VDWVQAGLGQPHIMGQGLDIFDQGNGRQVVVVTQQGSGKNRSPVQGVAGLVAGVRCRQWAGCQESIGRGIFGQGGVRQVMLVTRQGGGKNRSPVQGVTGLVAGVGWVRCRRWVPVGGWIGDAVLEDCRMEEEGISSRSGVVAGEPMGGRGPVPGMLLVEGSRCPEGGVGWSGVVDQPLHHGEVDHRCWRSGCGRWLGWQGGWEGVRVGGAVGLGWCCW